MRRLVSASLHGHARRFVAGGIAVVLSVAYVCAVLITVDSAKAAVQAAIAAQYSRADLVVSRSDGQVGPAMLERIKAVDGVAGAAAAARTYVDTEFPGGERRFTSVGTVPTDAELRWQEPISGRLPQKPGEVVVAAGVAESKDIAVGERLKVAGDPERPARKMTVVGVVASNAMAGGEELYVAEPVLFELVAADLASGDAVVRLAEDADEQQVSSALSAAGLAGADSGGVTVTVMSTEEKADADMRRQTGGIDLYGGLLLGFAAIAVFVAMLVVANTFTIMIAQRARELALFRCVGAAKGQVFGAVLAESAVLGLVFSLLGGVVGIALAHGALRLVNAFTPLNTPPDVMTIRPNALVIPIVLGVLVTIVAALAPARRATRVPPLAALHPEAAIRVRSRAGVLRLGLGALLLVAGGALLAVGMQGMSDDETRILIGIAGGAVSFLGVLLFAPILVPAVVRLLGLVARVGRVPGRVALGNSVRNPRRTAATASALLVGVTLISLLIVGAASSQATIARTLDTQFPFDLTVSTGGLAADDEEPEALPDQAVDAMADVTGIEAVAEVYGVNGRAGTSDAPVLISGVDVEDARAALRHDRPIAGLRDGVVVLGPLQANSLSVADGDELRLAAGEESLTLRVRIINEPLSPDVLVTSADLRRLTPDPVLIGAWAKATEDADPQAVVEGVEEALAAAPNAEPFGSFAERALYAQIADIMLMVASGLLGMAVAIALVGVGNTLSLSVLERTRENALLRALGLTSGQLRGTLGIEAALIAGTAVLIGIVLGIVYGYAGTAALLAGIPEVPEIRLEIPWARLLLVAAVAVGAGLLASVLPARRAAKVPPAAALSDD